MSISSSSQKISQEVILGRLRAHAKHGVNSIESVSTTETGKWLAILGEEFGEVCSTLTYDKDSAELRNELIDLVTVGTAWIAKLDEEQIDEIE